MQKFKRIIKLLMIVLKDLKLQLSLNHDDANVDLSM